MSLANAVPGDQLFVYHVTELRTVELSRPLSTNSVNPGKIFAER